jgi:hypothetical protein
MTRLIAAIAIASLSVTASAAEKPLPVTVENPVLPVEVRNADPIAVKVEGNSVQTPYSHDVASGDSTCTVSSCFIRFPAVPVGKMLVINHVSAYVRPSSSATVFDFAELTASSTEENIGARFIFPMARIGVAGTTVIADTWSVNAPVLAFVKAGQRPNLALTTRNGGADGAFFRQGTISGYLMDAP